MSAVEEIEMQESMAHFESTDPIDVKEDDSSSGSTFVDHEKVEVINEITVDKEEDNKKIEISNEEIMDKLQTQIDFESILEIFFSKIELYKIKIPNKKRVLTLSFLGFLCNICDPENVLNRDEQFFRELLTEQLEYHHKYINGLDETIDDGSLLQEQFDEIFGSLMLILNNLDKEIQKDEEEEKAKKEEINIENL